MQVTLLHGSLPMITGFQKLLVRSVGFTHLATFFGEGNAWRLGTDYFGGYPWEAATKATLQRESPINYVTEYHNSIYNFSWRE